MLVSITKMFLAEQSTVKMIFVKILQQKFDLVNTRQFWIKKFQHEFYVKTNNQKIGKKNPDAITKESMNVYSHQKI